MKLKKNIAVSESGYIFNPSTGDSYTANPIGMDILSFLKQDLSKDDIKSKVLLKYEADERQLNEDLEDFLAYLQQINILDKDES